MSLNEQNDYIQQRLTSNKKGERNHKSVAVINCLTGDVFSTITEAEKAYLCKTINNAVGDWDSTKKANGNVWCKLSLWQSFSDEEKEAYICDRLNSRRGKFNPSAKAVVNLATEEIFSTMKDAAERYSCNAAKICACCKKNNKTAGGQVWVYYDEYIRMSELERAHYLEYCLCRASNPARYSTRAQGIINLSKNKSYKTLQDASADSGLSTYSLREMCTRKRCSFDLEVWILAKDYELMDNQEVETYQDMCLTNGPLIKHNRRIRNNTTGEIFENAQLAARTYCCDYSSILKCCKGKVLHAGGYSWSFAE